MIKKEDIGMIIKAFSHAYVLCPNEKVRNLISELLEIWDKNKPTGIDLKNAFGRALYPEKKEIIND